MKRKSNWQYLIFLIFISHDAFSFLQTASHGTSLKPYQASLHALPVLAIGIQNIARWIAPDSLTTSTDNSPVKKWLIPPSTDQYNALSAEFDQLMPQKKKDIEDQKIRLYLSENDKGIRMYAQASSTFSPLDVKYLLSGLLDLLLVLYTSVDQEEWEDSSAEVILTSASDSSGDDSDGVDNDPNTLLNDLIADFPAKLEVENSAYDALQIEVLNSELPKLRQLHRLRHKREQALKNGNVTHARVLQDRVMLVSVEPAILDQLGWYLEGMINKLPQKIAALMASIDHGSGTSSQSSAGDDSSDSNDSSDSDSNENGTINAAAGNTNKRIKYDIDQDDEPPENPQQPAHTPERVACLACNNKPCRLKAMDNNQLTYQVSRDFFDPKPSSSGGGESFFTLTAGMMCFRDYFGTSHLLEIEKNLHFLTAHPSPEMMIYKPDVQLVTVEGSIHEKYMTPFLIWNPEKRQPIVDFNRFEFIHFLHPENYLTTHGMSYLEAAFEATYTKAKKQIIEHTKLSEDIIEQLFSIEKSIIFLAKIGKQLKESTEEKYRDKITNAKDGHDFFTIKHYHRPEGNEADEHLNKQAMISSYHYSAPTAELLESISDFTFDLDREIIEALININPAYETYRGAPIVTGGIDDRNAYSWLLQNYSVLLNNLSSGSTGSFNDMLRIAMLHEFIEGFSKKTSSDDRDTLFELIKIMHYFTYMTHDAGMERTPFQVVADYTKFPISPLFIQFALIGKRASRLVKQIIQLSKDNEYSQKSILEQFNLDYLDQLSDMSQDIEFLENLFIISDFRDKQYLHKMVHDNGMVMLPDGLFHHSGKPGGKIENRYSNHFWGYIDAFDKAQHGENTITMYFKQGYFPIPTSVTREQLLEGEFNGTIIQFREDQKQHARAFLNYMFEGVSSMAGTPMSFMLDIMLDNNIENYCNLALKLGVTMDEFVKKFTMKGAHIPDSIKRIMKFNNNLLSKETIFHLFNLSFKNQHDSDDEYYFEFSHELDEILMLMTGDEKTAAYLKLDFYQQADTELALFFLGFHLSEHCSSFTPSKQARSDLVFRIFEDSVFFDQAHYAKNISQLLALIITQKFANKLKYKESMYNFFMYALYFLEENRAPHIESILKEKLLEPFSESKHLIDLNNEIDTNNLKPLLDLLNFLNDYDLLIRILNHSVTQEIIIPKAEGPLPSILLKLQQYNAEDSLFKSIKTQEKFTEILSIIDSTLDTITGYDVHQPLSDLYIKCVVETDFVDLTSIRTMIKYQRYSSTDKEGMSNIVKTVVHRGIQKRYIDFLDNFLSALKEDENPLRKYPELAKSLEKDIRVVLDSQ